MNGENKRERRLVVLFTVAFGLVIQLPIVFLGLV